MTLNPLATSSPAHYTPNLYFVQTPAFLRKGHFMCKAGVG